jgi:hypothetical protein
MRAAGIVLLANSGFVMLVALLASFAGVQGASIALLLIVVDVLVGINLPIAVG